MLGLGISGPTLVLKLIFNIFPAPDFPAAKGLPRNGANARKGGLPTHRGGRQPPGFCRVPFVEARDERAETRRILAA